MQDPALSRDPDCSPNVFAIIHTWPDLKNAEYEVLQRILTAASHIDARPVVVDRNGTVLWAHTELDFTPGAMLPADSVAFVLSMHFESGRVLDAYSYITLWQPIEFYHDFGYQKSVDKVCSYNDLISCRSDLADAHGLNLLSALGRAPPTPLPSMFHMLPEPFLTPRTSETSKLFYIGINWERVGRPSGRFHDALMALDRLGFLDIYGPEKVMGVATWEGYDSYRGELPFDGFSVKNAVNRCGICLVLSSVPHKNAGIMSNRLFEGLVGGAAVIASPHPIIDRYFRDIVYLVDDSKGEDVLGQQIIEAVREIRRDPEEARRRTLEGQRILREQGFLLEASLANLIEATPQRVQRFEAGFLVEAEVTVILTYRSASLDRCLAQLDQLARQKRARITLHIVCGERFARRHGKALAAAARGSLVGVTCHPVGFDGATERFDGPEPPPSRCGPTTAGILREIATPYFAFLDEEDELFSEHFGSVAKALNDQPDAMVACTGMVVQTETADGRTMRNFDSARFTDYTSIILVNGAGQRARFVYRTALIDNSIEHLMKMLDGEEHSYFRLAGFLAGPLAQTNYASYMQHQSMRETTRPVEPIEHQRQYIRDLFARDPRWLKHLSSGGKIPEFIYAYSPGTPIRWNDYTPPAAVTQRIAPDTRLATHKDGEGLRFLSSGFSEPEAEMTWLAGERGVIHFALPPTGAERQEDYTLVLSVVGRRCIESGRNQHVTVAINGMVTHYFEVPDVPTDLRIDLPRMLLKGASTFQVELTPDHSEAVYAENGAVLDPRRLSLLLRALTLLRIVQVIPPMLKANETYVCGENYLGAKVLLSHFHVPEANLAWIAGCRGMLAFRLEQAPPFPELRLGVIGRTSVATGEQQTLQVTVNGRLLGAFDIPEGQSEVVVDLHDIELAGASLRVELEIGHAEAVYDKDHNIVDPRLIGLAITSVGMFEGAGIPRETPTISNGIEMAP